MHGLWGRDSCVECENCTLQEVRKTTMTNEQKIVVIAVLSTFILTSFLWVWDFAEVKKQVVSQAVQCMEQSISPGFCESI